MQQNSIEYCAICGRELGDELIQFHHLIPKTFKGTEGINIHAVCHKKLHATLTEREMLHVYHTVEKILEHPEIQKFVKWVSNKPLNFNDKVIETKHRYGKRRRK